MAVAVVVSVATAIGVYLLRPTGENRPDLGQLGVTSEIYPAAVEAAVEGPCAGTPPGQEETAPRCTNVTVRLLKGPDEGGQFELSLPDSPSTPDLSVGESVVVARQEDTPPGFEYFLVDRERRPVILALAVIFALAVVILGRLRGLAALFGLAASLAVLLTFILPAILDGRSPLMVATVGAAAIAILAIYLAHGFTPMSTVAVLGTLAGLVLTAGLGTAFVELAQISGFASEESLLVQVSGVNLNLQGLILGGIVIGALGVIDDVTVTQASAVWELRAADRTMKQRSLYRAGMRIGRDHVASTVNTLVLAYAGASLPLLVLFVLSRQSLGTVANGEVVATEIIRTLVGSIGLVATVPITTWLASRTAPRIGQPEVAQEPAPPPPRRRTRRERDRDFCA
jgi:uncharacterized membrane protein